MLPQRWHPVDIFIACLAPPKLYTTAFHSIPHSRQSPGNFIQHMEVFGVNVGMKCRQQTFS